MPFEVPESWEWVTLGELAFYKKGPFGSSLTKSMFVPKSNNSYKVYEQKNAINKDETLGTYYITESKFEELKGFEVFPNDIIVSCAGTIGETYVLPENSVRGIINQALMIIRLYVNSIQPFYLLFFDFVLKGYVINEGKGTAMKNIPPLGVLKNYLIALPPLSEQQRILKEVKRLFELIDNIEENKISLKHFIAQTKSKILDLAIRGKLVPQDPNDKPVSTLLGQINKKPPKITTDKSHYPFKIPNSWQWVELNRVLEYEQPTKYIVKSTEYSNTFPTPVLTAGKSFIIGYTDEKEGVFTDLPVIIFDDFTTNSKYVDFKFKVKSSAMKILRAKKDIVNIKYISFFMSITRLAGNTHKRYWISEYSKIKVPLPPFAEQKRIVAQIEKIFAELDIIEESLKT